MKKVSYILIDWSVRDNFGSVEDLNKQTVSRNEYEIIWVEYYRKLPEKIQQYIREEKIEKCSVLGNLEGERYWKHVCYNVGLVVSEGDVVCVPVSNGVFPETFTKSIIKTFEKHGENTVLFIGDGKLPKEKVTTSSEEMLSYICKLNYGKCMCATRKNMIIYGGFDEHEDFVPPYSGPYELGFRLVNAGCKEVWSDLEKLPIRPHPFGTSPRDYDPLVDPDRWVTTINNPPKIKGYPLLIPEIVKNKRTLPLVENSEVKELRSEKSV